jgi:hypothetical protein
MENGSAETNSQQAQATAGALPVRVECRDGEDKTWVEISCLHNITPRSAMLTLTQEPKLGQLLHLTLPSVRQKSAKAQKPNSLWALVWALAQTSAEASSDDSLRHSVSVLFVGDDVPAGVEKQEAAHFEYLVESDGRFRLQRKLATAAARGRDLRRESRIYIPVEVIVEALDDDGAVQAREHTVTENISRRGAAVWTTLEVEPRSVVRIASASCGVSLMSVVRGRRRGPDGIMRLHLEFTDGQWPLEGID